jgi:hypothetical protein
MTLQIAALVAPSFHAGSARAQVAHVESSAHADEIASLARRLAVAQADEEAARRDMERQKQIGEACLMMKDYEQARAQYERAVAARKAVAARLAAARAALAHASSHAESAAASSASNR